MSKMKSFMEWLNYRLPVTEAFNKHAGEYYAPKNFNFWYYFGVLASIVLVNQLVTGIWLTMSYEPSAEGAFSSVEYIMRDVDYGWIIRYMHSTGASAFFVVVYLHMFRGLLYGSYRKPRELVWIFGMLIYLALMAEAFMGYVLPWGQMSYWGAQVIVNLFGAIPGIGEALVEWIRGDYLISGITLNRFFALHVVALPIVLLALVVLHILALHQVGSNNPDGVEIKAHKDEKGNPVDGITFHPYYTVHDLQAIAVFLFIFCAVLFFMPEMGGFFLEYANFEEANNLKTPEHIAPVWYFTPFYAMLRAVTIDIGPLSSKFLGFIVMGAAIAVLFVLPWLDRAKARSVRYKGKVTFIMLGLFVSSFIILGVLGVKAATPSRTVLSQLTTTIYFAFLLGMPWWSRAGIKTTGTYVSMWFWGVLIAGISLSAISTTMSGTETDVHMIATAVYGLIVAGIFFIMPWLVAADSEKQEPERVTMDGGMGPMKVILCLVAVALLTALPLQASAAGGSGYPLDSANVDVSDQESLQRGAALFTNYCMGCHSLKFQRFERTADDLGIPHDIMQENLNFSGTTIGSLMEIPMTPDLGKQWFGAAPPDLTLVARARGVDWLYTYLRTFYKDPSRPMGVNNKVFPNVGMPHALLELQGLTECAPGPVLAANGGQKRDPLTGAPLLEDPCGTLAIVEPGKLSAEEYDQAVYDLVNFLAYTAEPTQLTRERIGMFVLLFIAVFFVFAYLLNREYWKDVH
ncbi:ubiquinol-cytochrome c reductase [uncultured Umboniibacter sp.]|uniref:ubiquinol-cytochrome c reductase n=1 Tax=uncultured Umboniibacter sp. TaxID=1798917 RepID=UPI00261F46CB|nr:ubiquinol-cytochrome c reductase [uncultured Umboniibacter sp.]